MRDCYHSVAHLSKYFDEKKWYGVITRQMRCRSILPHAIETRPRPGSDVDQQTLKEHVAESARERVSARHSDRLLLGIGTGTTAECFIRTLPAIRSRIEATVASLLHASMAINPARAGCVAARAVVLVDDVFTSGATFLEAGAKTVFVIALARAAKLS